MTLPASGMTHRLCMIPSPSVSVPHPVPAPSGSQHGLPTLSQDLRSASTSMRVQPVVHTQGLDALAAGTLPEVDARTACGHHGQGRGGCH